MLRWGCPTCVPPTKEQTMTPLRARMIEDMKLGGLADKTQEVYQQAVRGLAKHYRRPPDQLSEAEVRRYLLDVKEQGAARGTFKTCHYGIQFFYRQTLGRDWPLFKKKIRLPKQKRLPQALSHAEVQRILGNVRNPIHKACFALIYACGLRISEAATLEVTAIDKVNRLLRILGKGDKERLVPLPRPVHDGLREMWKAHRNPRWLFPNSWGTGPLSTNVLVRTFADAVELETDGVGGEGGPSWWRSSSGRRPGAGTGAGLSARLR